MILDVCWYFKKALAEKAVKPWGQKTTYIKIPNNCLVEICTEIQYI